LSSKIKREIVYYTDDELDAHREMQERILCGDIKLAVGEVRKMVDPPETTSKFIVFRIIED
jgi:hypothetical protein